VVTGGVIFAGTSDKFIRALDEQTGKVLWEMELSAPAAGIPAVYEVAGREYIVFCTADSYVALALPRSPS
jgi:quinoprotein glucose dehydrogenase